jgi:hypothetical protein
MLFFGTIAFAGSLAAEKNSYLDVRKAALSLSYIMTEKGVVTPENWAAKKAAVARAADASGVFVVVTVKRFCFDSQTASGGEIVFPQTPLDPEGPFYVENSNALKRTWLYATNNEDVSRANPPVVAPARKLVVMLNYPVAVPCPAATDSNYGFGMLNVIVWRK